jgi:hypothetical protein
MEQKKSNQERSRKYGGSSSFVDSGEPSKAPRQDEDPQAFVGPSDPDQTPKYNTVGEQGISNRLAEEEHAFPESKEPAPEAAGPDSVETTPKQQGGHRGAV